MGVSLDDPRNFLELSMDAKSYNRKNLTGITFLCQVRAVGDAVLYRVPACGMIHKHCCVMDQPHKKKHGTFVAVTTKMPLYTSPKNARCNTLCAPCAAGGRPRAARVSLPPPAGRSCSTPPPAAPQGTAGHGRTCHPSLSNATQG